MVFAIAGAGVSRYRASGGASSATYRYPWNWPFSADSYVNVGIGSNAVYGPTTDSNVYGIVSSNSNGEIGVNFSDNSYNYPLWVAATTDPLYYVTPDTSQPNAQSGAIRLPSGAYTSSSGDDILQCFDKSNPTYYWGWNNGCSIDTGSISQNGTIYAGEITGGYQHRWDTRGNGVPYFNSGGCGLPGYRMTDFNAGVLNRMLPCSMKANTLYCWNTSDGQSPNAVWPGVYSDYQVIETGYNTSGGVPFGSIWFVPSALYPISNLGYAPGTPQYLIAYQAQYYGFFVSNQANNAGIFTTYTDQTISSGSTIGQAISTVLNQLAPHFRVMGSWMYAPGKWGLLSRSTNPSSAPGPGYQYSPSYNSSAPINGGGTYPSAPPNFYPSVGIGTGATFNTSGVVNGPASGSGPI